MGCYDRFVLPRLIDWAMDNHVVDRQRAKVVVKARGRVLEVGAGSGLNFPFYDTRVVEQLVALEPSDELRTKAASRITAGVMDVRFVGGVAESIPLEDEAVDTVVLTYTLCSVSDPRAALSEIERVLKPGGSLLFSEHGRAPDPGVRRWQARLAPLWKMLAGGCHLDRPIEELIGGIGFDSTRIESAYLPGFKALHHTTWGVATKGIRR